MEDKKHIKSRKFTLLAIGILLGATFVGIILMVGAIVGRTPEKIAAFEQKDCKGVVEMFFMDLSNLNTRLLEYPHDQDINRNALATVTLEESADTALKPQYDDTLRSLQNVYYLCGELFMPEYVAEMGISTEDDQAFYDAITTLGQGHKSEVSLFAALRATKQIDTLLAARSGITYEDCLRYAGHNADAQINCIDAYHGPKYYFYG